MLTSSTVHTLNAVTATTVGAPIIVRKAKRITLFVKRSNHSAGSSAFTVEVSPNFSTLRSETAVWVAYNKLIDNVVNSNAQTPTRIATKTLSSNTQDFVTMDLEGGDTFEAMRVTATETTDGIHDAWVVIEYAG